MSHPTKRPLLHGQAPASTSTSTSTPNEAALPILEARFGVIAQALTGSTIATSAYSTIIPALQSFLSPALTVTRGQVFGPTSTTSTLPTTSPHPLQGLLIIDRSYPSISASPSSPAASDHWFPIESVAGYIELSDAYDEYELVRLRASIDQLHKLSLQSETRRSTTSIPVFHLCLSSGTASLASASSTSLDLHVVAHSVALRFAHDTGMKGVFILNEGMVVRHDCLFPSGTTMATQPSTAPFVVARIKTHGHGPVLGMALLLAHALAGVNNETSRNAHLIKQYAKASVWQATAPEPRSHQPTARSSVIAATQAAAQSVIQHVNKQQQSQPKKQESSTVPSQTQPSSSQTSSQAQPQTQTQTQTQPSQQKQGRGKKQGQVQGDKLAQTQPVKSRPQSATSQKKNDQQEKKSEIQEKKETVSPSQSQQKQQQQKQRPKSARTSMSATMNVEKKSRPSTAGTTIEKSTTSVDVDDDDDDTDVRTDVDLTVVGTHVSGIVGDVKPPTTTTTTTTENKKKGKGKKGGKQQQQQDETKQTSKPAVPVQQKSINNHTTTPGGPSTTTTTTATTTNGTNNKSTPKKHNRRRSNQQQRKNSNASYKPVTPATVPLSLPEPPKSTAQVLAEKLLTSPSTTEKKEAKTPYDDDFNPFA